MDFITGVNRLLRTDQIIGGDDDDITTFSDTQHAADIELAQIAIQDELGDLVSDRLISYEKTSNSISLVTGTRVYALQTDFKRFFGSRPSFYDSTNNTRIYEFKGGEDALRDTDYQYDTTQGTPQTWYWDDTTAKQVAFYQVPSATYNGRSFTYQYEKSVSVTAASDTLPFHNDEEAQAFISMSVRRFKVMDQSLQIDSLESDPIYKAAKARLLGLMRPTNPANQYGRRFG